jgi:hypothetical protein
VSDLSLFDTAPHPRWRSSDPQTSVDAALSITPDALRENQVAVLNVLRLYGPLTDEGIAAWYGDRPKQSPSGLRTRRHELQELGLVEDSGKRARLRSGRQAIVWRAS